MIFESSRRAYNSSEKKYTNPVWVLDTNKKVIIHTDEDTLEEERYSIYRDCERYHLNYLAEYGHEKLQRLLDNGEIIDYLEELSNRVYEACDSQVELWKEDDSEYLEAQRSGDIVTEAAIINRLEAQAKEIIYPIMVYTL